MILAVVFVWVFSFCKPRASGDDPSVADGRIVTAK